MTTTDLIYDLARARQEEDRWHAQQRQRALEAASARMTRPRRKLRLSARPHRAASAGA